MKLLEQCRHVCVPLMLAVNQLDGQRHIWAWESKESDFKFSFVGIRKITFLHDDLFVMVTA